MPSTPTSTCPETEATVTRPSEPVFPYGMKIMAEGPISVEALVTAGVDGTVKAVTITKSSGYKFADDAVVRAARISSYRPKMVNCEPVEGTYKFRIDEGP
jgi:TonB family protein